jgi:hypothetical protein
MIFHGNIYPDTGRSKRAAPYRYGKEDSGKLGQLRNKINFHPGLSLKQKLHPGWYCDNAKD